MLYQHRRPRYQGSSGIGRWKTIMQTISWIAVIVNALILTYTSDATRDEIVISAITGAAECAPAFDPAHLSDEARALGLNISLYSDCARNYKNCFAQIGGEEWLPALEYLAMSDATTREYFEFGLCAEGSALYNQAHCDLCTERRQTVAVVLAWIFIGIEHVLVLTKLLMRLVLPEKPRWVIIEEAHAEFRTEQLEKEAKAKLLKAEVGSPAPSLMPGSPQLSPKPKKGTAAPGAAAAATNPEISQNV